jgi:hypothetical protein
VQAQAHAYGRSDGTLGPAEIDLPGAWYSSTPTITVDPPDNPEVDPADYETATYTTSIVEGANPVCAGVTGGERTGGDVGGPRETDCVPGHIGFEPANPAAGHLIGIARQFRLR